MSDDIAWIDGRWGHPDALGIPLSDRGLQLADGVFETILVRAGRTCLLEEHLRRWRTGADLLGLPDPPPKHWLEPLIHQAIQRAGLVDGNGALRLNWSRGSSRTRGLAVAEISEPRAWLSLQHCSLTFSSIAAVISRHERRNPWSRLSRCKSFAYGQGIQARREAQAAGAHDALLLNTENELCSGTASNLLVHRKGAWLTPPLSSGCLPGVMRGRALATGICREAALGRFLQPSDQALLINSLSCRAIASVNGAAIGRHNNPAALWNSLLAEEDAH